MKKLSKNPIDQYFRENLESPDLEYNKQDWKGLEKMLPKNQNKKSSFWWLPASVAAAIALLFISLWLNKPVTNTGEAVNNKVKVSGTEKISPAESKTTNTFDALSKLKSSSAAPSISANTNQNSRRDLLSTDLVRISASTSGNADMVKETMDTLSAVPPLPFNGVLTLQHPEDLFASNVEIASNYEVYTRPVSDIDTTSPDENPGSKFSIGLSFSPDINSISSFSESSFGSSAGIAASYQISQRLSISTAIAYSRKVYSAAPHQYKAPWAYSGAGKDAALIDADCRVLDIPLNFSYNIIRSPKRTIFASAGMSSYFMLKEKYTLIADSKPSGYPSYPNRSYNYSNMNKHLLSVLNLSAGMSKPISKQTNLVIEPYMRLPVSGIGQGKVQLKSIGLNLQFKYNFKMRSEKVNPKVDAQ